MHVFKVSYYKVSCFSLLQSTVYTFESCIILHNYIVCMHVFTSFFRSSGHGNCMRPFLVPCWITYIKGRILLIIIRQCYKHFSAYCSKMDSLEAKIFVTMLQILADTVGSLGELELHDTSTIFNFNSKYAPNGFQVVKTTCFSSESLPASMSSMLSSSSIVSCSSFAGSSSNSGRPSSSLNHCTTLLHAHLYL